MSLKEVHPLYTATIDDQTLVRDAYAGERVVKDKDTEYLPPTPGMLLDGMNAKQQGRMSYLSYKQRAVYPDFVSVAVESLLGVMHNKPPTFELPPAMESMLEHATVDGETLEGLLRRINEQQLVTGRLGAMLDLPASPDPANPMPFIALYASETIRNWDDSDDNLDLNKLSMVVLDESGFQRKDQFKWEKVDRYRVLVLGAGVPVETGIAGDSAGTAAKQVYSQGVYEGESAEFDPTQLMSPSLRGKTLEQIPFVFFNTKDNLGRPDNPPLLGLARAALTVYQGEADYRQALFLQGQDTLVVIGGVRSNEGSDETRVGAGSMIEVEQGGDAKYIGVSSNGLPEMRTALENDYKRAEQKTGQLVDNMSGDKESGEALKTRVKAQTATLNQIARTGAAGLQRLLRAAAEWLGLDPELVKVNPNLEFADISMTGKDLVDLMTAKNMGAPISSETIHLNMQERGLTKLQYQDEMDIINEEDPVLGTLSGGGSKVLNQTPEEAAAAAADAAAKADAGKTPAKKEDA